MSIASEPKATFAFVSLGCPKNLVDSERMLGLLGADGYAIQAEPDGADFVIVNTCGFIEPARQESLGVIREMIELKRQGQIGGVIVAGCLAERKKEALFEEVPEIDHVVGVFGREEITKVAERFVNRLDEQRSVFRPAPVKALDDRARLRITPRHYAYLKISEGCDRLCTFCAIPGMRGKHVTKPIDQVVAEAEELACDGVRELNIVAQDTTYYGRDLYGELRLAELLRELQEIEKIRWIRLLYCYPQGFTDELIDVLKSSKKIVRYIDLPLQHINDRMLRLMARRVDRLQTEQLLATLRRELPGLVLRTTFIVGFPGETEAEFHELVEFVAETKFERVGVFEYSYEPETPATRLPGHLPDEVKAERRARLMEVQQQIAFDWNRQQIGRTLDVLMDGPAPLGFEISDLKSQISDLKSQISNLRSRSDGLWVGRSYADAPEIDESIYVTGRRLRPGTFVPVRIVAADGYDLIGEHARK
jgi:ribosomal protein S12 methylthiotransferase